MKVLFLQKDIHGRLAVMLLAAILEKEGHQCDVLVGDLERNMVKKALEINPDIIAFTITTGEHLWMNQIGKKLREQFDKFIICGGSHPTFYPEVINEDYLDAICMGEGEGAIVEFVNSIANGKDIIGIRNLIVKKNGELHKNEIRPLIEDLDSLPFANRTIYDKYNIYRDPYNALSGKGVMLTSRGCPFHCAFCLNIVHYKPYVELYGGKVFRRRSALNIIKELRTMKKHNPQLNFISFTDDIFTLPPKTWIFEFLELYKNEINIPYTIQTRVDLLDEEIVKKLKESNCISVIIGVESGNDFLRNTILKKGITKKQILRATSLIKTHHIKLQIFNMLGTPGETLETALETYELNRKIKPTFAWCAFLNPYPGTELYEYAITHNYLDKTLDFKKFGYLYFFTGTPVKIKNKREIYHLLKLFNFGVIFNLPPNVMKFLIKLPFTKLYDLIFGVSYFFGILRIRRAQLLHSLTYIIYSLKIAILNFAKYILKSDRNLY